MYKLLLCLHYLRTRYLAFVCIVSVMLGVATLIVVNSVMEGFSSKLKDRLHGILSDVLVETERSDGFLEPPEQIMQKLRESEAGSKIVAMAPTMEVFALLQFTVRDRYGRPTPITKHVRCIGIDPTKQGKVGPFREYLVRQRNVEHPSFALSADAVDRFQRNRLMDDLDTPLEPVAPLPPPLLPTAADSPAPLTAVPPLAPEMPAGPPRIPSIILGYSLAHVRFNDAKTGAPREHQWLRPGDDVTLATLGGTGLKPVSSTFVVTDFYQSEMSEYDGSFVYVPLEELQRLRGLDGRCNTIQVRLSDDIRGDAMRVIREVVTPLQKLFPPGEARVESWQEKQGPLLRAIDTERGILVLLLFLIVGVAGFSVLAIFTMIVGEKYRDIGILKSLGASDSGVLAIFLTYGLLLGTVGCLLGTAAGLTITYNINEIEAALTQLTGQQIFDRGIYYFDRIPTHVDPFTVLWVNLGAAGIAVAFSILPAWRAARLHPVRALRFE